MIVFFLFSHPVQEYAAQWCSENKFIHEEHNSQTVETRWEMGTMSERW